MKILRKTAAVILCFVLITALFPTPEFSAADGELIDGVYYKYDKYDGTAAVTGCDDSATEITINPKFNGHAVTKIAYSAFKDKSALKKVTIPDSITSIAGYAFYGCTGLTSITIPNSVTSIEGSAFEGCTGLTSITIPDSVTSIGNSAFSGCRGLTSINIPNRVTSIGSYAFSGCTGLTSITIPDSVTSIGDSAFSGCKNLTVKAIDGSYAAEYARKNKIPLYLFSKTPESPIIKEYEYDKENGKLTITVDRGNDERFEYSTDSVSWQKEPVLEVKINSDGKYKVYQRVAATSEDNESFPSKPVIFEVAKAPAVSSVTETSITLNTTAGFEYRMDNGKWQDSNVFENLPLNSTHTFEQRKKSSENFIGLESSSVSVSTAKHVHTAVGGWQTDASGHYKLCSCGQEFDRENHKGGEATCVTNAVCEVCGASYGDVNANNHKNTHVVGQKDATCCEKGYTGDVFCDDCQTTISVGTEIAATGNHVDADGKWEFDERTHFHTCGCGTEFDRENHKGGEATCSSVAVCEICGKSYGKKNLTNHKNTEIRGKVPATCSKEGYTGDIYCLDCGKKISSGETIGKQHNYKDEVVLPILKTPGYTLHTCAFCGDTYKDNYTFYVPSETDPLVAVSSVRGIIGKQVKVAVSLKNNPGIVSMGLRLNYDANILKLVKVEDCGILGEQVHRPSLGTPYYLSWANDTSTENFTVNGNIAILTFEILEDAPLGKTPISVSYDYGNFDIYDVNGEEVAFATQNGTVDVTDVLLGDVNGDGIVNNYDRLLLTRWLAKWPEALEKGIIEAAADVNCDGKINNLDRLILTRHLAHWEEYATLPYTK